MKIVLKFIFSILTKFTNFDINYVVISNESINAFFLSRYIAKKLKQKLSVRRVLNPLKREFYRITKVLSYPKLSYFRLLNKQNLDIKQRKFFIKKFWCFIFFLLFIFYDKFLCSYYSLSNTWFSLDIYLIYANLRDEHNLNKSKELIHLSSKFNLRRSIFVYLFINNISLFIKTFSKIFLNNTLSDTYVFNFNNIYSNIKFFNYIFLELLTSNYILLKSKKFMYYNLKFFQIIIIIIQNILIIIIDHLIIILID